ncbi:helix-turn-helix domain-containing protein [Elioraea sp.]|uniref:helix-turn-helix domain-containing protein n=1 Tax=Elioraea sp. TaxID=2185103 RepID=UPI0025BE0794|nr:cupin domain-containing protein [Elioraea sp.]
MTRVAPLATAELRPAMPLDLEETDQATAAQKLGAVGQKLRWRRKIRAFSLQRVAERSGISIGLLSEIERGLSTPSPQVLKQICRALEMPIGWLFDGEASGDGEEGPIVRAGARRGLDFGAKGMSKELMTPDSVPGIQMMRIVLEPGGGSGPLGTDAPDGAKCGTVLAGRFGLSLGGREHELGPGDSFAFHSRAPHRFWCIGDAPCEVLWVVTPAVY